MDTLENEEVLEKMKTINEFFNNENKLYNIDMVEEAMQKVMDEYAGGIAENYMYSKNKLHIAAKRIDELMEISNKLKAEDLHELLFIYEIIDRLYVAKVLIVHLITRTETRWKCYQQNGDYPEKDDSKWLRYINSLYIKGEVKIILRDLVGRDEIYEHKN